VVSIKWWSACRSDGERQQREPGTHQADNQRGDFEIGLHDAPRLRGGDPAQERALTLCPTPQPNVFPLCVQGGELMGYSRGGAPRMHHARREVRINVAGTDRGRAISAPSPSPTRQRASVRPPRRKPPSTAALGQAGRDRRVVPCPHARSARPRFRGSGKPSSS
jgi:hypothetical protein